MKLKDSVALVTGASSGIGAATAERLAKAGYKVYGTRRRTSKDGPRSFQMLQLDVTSDESVEAVIRDVMKLEGRIDVLVNNAGFGIAPGAAEESSIRQAQAIFDTNVFGIMRMTRAVLPHMRARSSGRIINISSVLGFLPMPYGALYAATKHAVEGYSESVDHEVRTRGVRCLLVEPGYTRTAFDTNFIAPDAQLPEYREISLVVEQVTREHLAAADHPQVVAEAVLKAATDARPKLRYLATAGAGRLRLARRFAPASIVDSAVRKNLRIDSVPATLAPNPALGK